MPKNLYSILIAGGIGYLLLKLLPNLTQNLQQQQGLVVPLQSTITPGIAIAGSTFGILSSMAAAISKGNTPVKTQPIRSATLPPSAAAGGLPSLTPNFGQGLGLDQDQGGVIVPTYGAATAGLLPPPVVFEFPNSSNTTLASVIGNDLPIQTFDQQQQSQFEEAYGPIGAY